MNVSLVSKRVLAGTAAICIGLVASGGTSLAVGAAGHKVSVGKLHHVLTSFNAVSGTSLACPPGKPIQKTTCYLVGSGPGGTPPPGTTPFPPADYLNEVVPIHNGVAGKPVAFPGSESAALISCPGGSTCDAAGYATFTTAALIPIAKGKPGKPVVVSGGRFVWEAIACRSAGNCVAVGSKYKSAKSSVAHGVIVRLHNGKLASVQVLNATSAVNGVACSSNSACRVVGATFSSSFHTHGFFAAVKNGHAGKLHVVHKAYSLFGLACGWTKTTCVAAGNTILGSQGSLPNRVLLHGNSVHITTLKSSAPIGSYVCPKTGNCLEFGVVKPNEPGEHGFISVVHKGKIGKPATVHGTSDVDAISCSKLGSCASIASQLHGKNGDYSVSSFALRY